MGRMEAKSHKGSLAHSFDVGKLSMTLARSSSRVWAYVFSVRSGSECRASSRTSRVPSSPAGSQEPPSAASWVRQDGGVTSPQCRTGLPGWPIVAATNWRALQSVSGDPPKEAETKSLFQKGVSNVERV